MDQPPSTLMASALIPLFFTITMSPDSVALAIQAALAGANLR
jgi:hypothetical protein